MMQRTTTSVLPLCLALLLLGALPARAWNIRGHFRVARAAALAQPDEVPSFFRWGADAIGHSAVDPDVWKERETPAVRHQEYPEHFLDFELVEEIGIPDERYEFVRRVVEASIDPSRVGFVPYAVVENTERLALAFAEHRCWPDNPYVRAKALTYAGILGHYAADMVQPLHTTVHYDGRTQPDGSSPRSGIHARVDGLFERSGFEIPTDPPAVETFADLGAAVRAEFAASFALVDQVYELETDMAALHDDGVWSAELQSFTADRYRRAVGFLGSLYRTAWRSSEAISLAGWLQRTGPGGEVVHCRAAAVSE